MKSKKSLNKRLLTYLGVSAAIFIILYSLIIAAYFMLGITLSNHAILANESRAYAKDYAIDNKFPKPERSFLLSFRSADELPLPLIKLFPAKERIHDEMLIIDTTDFFLDPMILEQVDKLTYVCESNPCELILFYSYQLEKGQWLYLVMGVNKDNRKDDEMELALYTLFSLAGAFFIALMSLSFALIKNISQPITQLTQWTQSLSIDNFSDELPNFRFKELEIVAAQLQGAFERIGLVLENEKRFLNNASHELRTPVAVLVTNLALLEKLREKDNDDAAQNKVIERLIRAAENMKQLMQTVLWLSKDMQDMPLTQEVILDDLIRQIELDNDYLLANKEVDVNARLATLSVDVPVALCTIVLTNLIRNAYQYTHKGEIYIELTEDYIRVTNRCVKEQKKSLMSVEEYGFGLGIELVKRASEKLGWCFESKDVSGGRRVTLYFDK